MIDAGIYNKDPEAYEKLLKNLYENHSNGITLPPEYASFVEEDLLRFLIRLARYKFVTKMIKKTDRVLEVGCGSGLGSIFLSQHCNFVKGIDIKETEITEARSINKRKNIEFEKIDLFEMNDEKSFDVIVALDVIEHLEEKLGLKLIEQMSKKVNKDGMVIIGTPSFYSFPYQGALSQASHVKCYDQKELEILLSNFFARTLFFSMNDEMVHTGFYKMAWYYFSLSFLPKN